MSIKNNLKDNISALIESHGLKSWRQLADMCGVSNSFILKIKNELVDSPGVEAVKKIADYFNTSIDILINDISASKIIAPCLLPSLTDNDLKMWLGKNSKNNFKEYSNIFLSVNAKCSANSFCYKAMTSQYAPTIPENFYVVVDADIEAEDKSLSLVTIQNSDEKHDVTITIRKIIKIDNKTYTLPISSYTNIPPEPVGDDIKFIGKIVHSFGDIKL